jgi:hypothetical protein
MITKQTHHDACEVYVQTHPGKTHQYSLRCRPHDVWIQWLTIEDVVSLSNHGVWVEIAPGYHKPRSQPKPIVTLAELGL